MRAGDDFCAAAGWEWRFGWDIAGLFLILWDWGGAGEAARLRTKVVERVVGAGVQVKAGGLRRHVEPGPRVTALPLWLRAAR